MKKIEYKWIVAVTFVLGLFMDIMDTTIVNVAIPALKVDLHTNESTIQWVVLGYLLSLAVWIPASGWLGDRIGTKKVYLFALFAFTAASALCGFSQTAGQLIAFRILQGVGGGMLTPVGTTMLFRAFPPEERAKASAVLMVPAVIAPALGPVLGGWLVTDVNWRWIFYVNLPMGIAAFIFGLVFLREGKQDNPGKFDIAGFLLSGGGLALLLYALSTGPEDGWLSTWVLATGIVGLLLFIALVVVELRLKEPMLDLRLFKDSMFCKAVVIQSVSFGSFAGLLFLLPQFLQTLRGLTALQSGLATFPQAIGMIISIPIVGRLYPKVGPRRLIVAGMAGATVIAFAFVGIDFGTSVWAIRGLMFVRGIMMAVAFVPLQTATYANISKEDTGRASALFSTQRQVGGSLGVAIIVTVWLSSTKSLSLGKVGALATRNAVVSGYHAAFFAIAVISLVCTIFALAVKDSEAQSTINRD